MKVLISGHRYELSHFENYGLPGCPVQTLQFIEKRPDKVDGTLVTVNDGTTNEEVIAVLIDRINYLNSEFPCRENSIALRKLEEALLWLNHRTAKRKERGVEGKPVA